MGIPPQADAGASAMTRAIALTGMLALVTACARQPTVTYRVQAPPPAGPPTQTQPHQPCNPFPEAASLPFQTTIENQLFDMIDELRTNAHVPSLTRDEGALRGAARERAYEQRSPYYSLPLAYRLTRWCVPNRASDEVAAPIPPGSYPAPDFITYATNLPAAKAVLLNPAYDRIGIAVYRGGYPSRLYAALLLIDAP